MLCDGCGRWSRHCITLDGRDLCEECVQKLVDGLRAQVPASDLARRFAALPEDLQEWMFAGIRIIGDYEISPNDGRVYVVRNGYTMERLPKVDTRLEAAEAIAKHMREVGSGG